VPWWSLALSTVALSVLGAALAGQVIPLRVGAVVVPALACCCLVLVAAELIHRSDHDMGASR
jgi:hypothetical protein